MKAGTRSLRSSPASATSGSGCTATPRARRISTGTGNGLGVALTAAAGYPAPSLVGLGAAVLLTLGHLTGMLLLGLVLLIALGSR